MYLNIINLVRKLYNPVDHSRACRRVLMGREVLTERYKGETVTSSTCILLNSTYKLIGTLIAIYIVSDFLRK